MITQFLFLSAVVQNTIFLQRIDSVEKAFICFDRTIEQCYLMESEISMYNKGLFYFNFIDPINNTGYYDYKFSIIYNDGNIKNSSYNEKCRKSDELIFQEEHYTHHDLISNLVCSICPDLHVFAIRGLLILLISTIMFHIANIYVNFYVMYRFLNRD